MAKYYGKVGFVKSVETSDGIWEEVPTERSYYGDILKNRITTQNPGSVNPNMSIATEISLISDAYANENFDVIRYIVYLGKKWNVTSVDPEYPRIRVMLGGLYNR